jgi:hypothetical protein
VNIGSGGGDAGAAHGKVQVSREFLWPEAPTRFGTYRSPDSVDRPGALTDKGGSGSDSPEMLIGKRK